MKKKVRYSPEVKACAVRLFSEHRHEHGSRWAAVELIATKIGCTPQTLSDWITRHEIDSGTRDGISSEERENRELRKANEILKLASAFFAQAELDRRLKP